jgi:hypothetical protein
MSSGPRFYSKLNSNVVLLGEIQPGYIVNLVVCLNCKFVCPKKVYFESRIIIER